MLYVCFMIMDKEKYQAKHYYRLTSHKAKSHLLEMIIPFVVIKLDFNVLALSFCHI